MPGWYALLISFSCSHIPTALRSPSPPRSLLLAFPLSSIQLANAIQACTYIWVPWGRWAQVWSSKSSIRSGMIPCMSERGEKRREESKVGGRDGGVEKWCEIEHFINTNKMNRPTGPSGKKMTWWGAAGIKFNIGSSSPSTANLWVCIDLDLSSLFVSLCLSPNIIIIPTNRMNSLTSCAGNAFENVSGNYFVAIGLHTHGARVKVCTTHRSPPTSHFLSTPHVSLSFLPLPTLSFKTLMNGVGEFWTRPIFV